MELKVLGSNSYGNGYILKSSSGEVLIIDAGCKFSEAKKALGFDISGVKGLIYDHFHGDHFKYIDQYLEAGIPCYGNKQSYDKHGKNDYNLKVIEPNKQFEVGSFSIVPFSVAHDVGVDCFGFLISQEELGKLVFITDSKYSPYKFRDINHWMVEANYCEKIFKERELQGRGNDYVSNRVRSSHLSVQTCVKLLQANDLTQTENIILLHLSNGNSDEARFKSMVENATGKNTFIADTGLSVNLNKYPF